MSWYVVLNRPALISAIIACGADTEITDQIGRNPLYAACSSVKRECIEALLEGGADPNVGKEMPLLEMLAGDGNEELVALLISFGADVDIAGREGLTPLMVATRLGRLGVVRLLVAAGARLDLRDRSGRIAADFIAEISDPDRRTAVLESLQSKT